MRRLFYMSLLFMSGCNSDGVDWMSKSLEDRTFHSLKFFKSGELCFFGADLGQQMGVFTYVPCDKIDPRTTIHELKVK